MSTEQERAAKGLEVLGLANLDPAADAIYAVMQRDSDYGVKYARVDNAERYAYAAVVGLRRQGFRIVKDAS